MEYAISMYQGGKRVYAKNCNFNSYLELGLVCPVCKQEVYLRKGDVIKPYFAHLHATNSRQVKQCSLRVSSDEYDTVINDLIEDRGQRLKIFQQHFLNLVYSGNSQIANDVNFNNWINSRKDENGQAINNFIIKCIEYFIKHQEKMEKKYVVESSQMKDTNTLIQQQIALEVMSYLCENAQFNYNLRYILFYSMYQLYRYDSYKLIRQDVKKQYIDNICQYTVRIIMINPWISVLKKARYSNVNKIQSQIVRINKHEILRTSVQSSKPRFLVYGGKQLDKPIRYTLEVTSTKPFELTIFYHSSRNKQDETINKKTEVMKIKTGIGYLKPEFEIIPLEDSLVFSSMVDDRPVAFNFHYEVVKNLALPYWIDNAEQYVSLNELSPVWLVIAKLWLKATYNDNADEQEITEILDVKPFNEAQWWESLIEASNILPSCIQFKNAIKTIPNDYKHLLEFQPQLENKRKLAQARRNTRKDVRYKKYNN